MMKRFREEYRKGRLTADNNYHTNKVRKGLRKAPPGATHIYAKVPAASKDILLRRGWAIVERSNIMADGNAGSWLDAYTMSLPLDAALTQVDGHGRVRA
jgi:hypothetical protein